MIYLGIVMFAIVLASMYSGFLIGIGWQKNKQHREKLWDEEELLRSINEN